jgi:hypothetical protein
MLRRTNHLRRTTPTLNPPTPTNLTTTPSKPESLSKPSLRQTQGGSTVTISYDSQDHVIPVTNTGLWWFIAHPHHDSDQKPERIA